MRACRMFRAASLASWREQKKLWTPTQNLTQGGLHAPDMSAERKKDILIVDDMPDHLRVLIEILGARHYNIRPALGAC